jgi:histone H3/H4
MVEKTKATFQFAVIKRTMQTNIPENMRVSKEAIVELDKILAGIVSDYMKKAAGICQNAKRVTINAGDIALAFE